MSNVQTVQEIYAAFGRGDIPAILDRLADDVAFDPWAGNAGQSAGVPWLLERRGRDGAIEFFEVVADLGIRDLRVLSIMDGGDQVAVEVEVDTTDFSDEEIHLWSFDADGNVTRMRHYADTAKHVAAVRAREEAAAAS